MSPKSEPDIVIASALYQGAKPFLKDFFESIERASKNYNIRVILTCEDFDDWKDYLPSESLNVYAETIKTGLSLGQARGDLLKLAKKHVITTCIFVDADDMLTSDAITHYLQALEQTDFAFGNLALVDATGHKLPHQALYQEWGMSGSINDPAILLNGNVMGLGAVALNKVCLDNIPELIPENLIGVDWWIFHHLLEQGFKSQFIQNTTVLYRQHGNNVSGIFSTNDRATLKKRAQIALVHFKHLQPSPEITKRLNGLEHLIAMLDDDTGFDMLDFHNNKPIPWYSDVIEMALKLADQRLQHGY